MKLVSSHDKLKKTTINFINVSQTRIQLKQLLIIDAVF